MRLWSIHPRYLDNIGLLRCWNESLTAQNALVALQEGRKVGYMNHPQLERFKASSDPIKAIGAYLWWLAYESRKYERKISYPVAFDLDKIIAAGNLFHQIPVTDNQLRYEKTHLLNKLALRAELDRWWILDSRNLRKILHPMFYIVPGSIESWEKIKADQ